MKLISFGVVSQNRKAHFNYTIIDTFEAGIILKGAEVKSLRKGTANITEAFVVERDGSLILQNCYIPLYQKSVLANFDTRAPRKLLLHKKEIAKITKEATRNGMAIVVTDIHFNERGKAKVTIALGKGKKLHDKRQHAAEQTWKRDKARIIKNGRYD